MSLSTPSGAVVPAVIVALAARMDASPAWLAATSSATGRLFYPVTDPGASLPYAVLAPMAQRRAKIAPGVSIPAGGQVAIHITTAADPMMAESLAEAVLSDLLGGLSGLHILDGEAGLASVAANREAAHDGGPALSRTIVLTLTYGFKP